jgi:hypothetical protein
MRGPLCHRPALGNKSAGGRRRALDAAQHRLAPLLRAEKTDSYSRAETIVCVVSPRPSHRSGRMS